MYLAEGPVLMLIENGTQWRSWGTLHPARPSERIIPMRNGTVPPPPPGQGWYVVRFYWQRTSCTLWWMGLPHRQTSGSAQPLSRGTSRQGTPQRYAPTLDPASPTLPMLSVEGGLRALQLERDDAAHWPFTRTGHPNALAIYTSIRMQCSLILMCLCSQIYCIILLFLLLH